MIRKLFPQKTALWALDFGERTVTALAARQTAAGVWQVLGRGEAAARGRRDGEIVKTGDVVESVVEALRQAERGAGLRCRALHFNFDDSQALAEHPSGTKSLAGEGQISRQDVRDAARSAMRLVGDFERACVYTREVEYLIDGKDSVRNPIGVFGNRLDVTLLVVLARARALERWKSVMRRAQIPRFSAVLTLDSVCHAVLGASAPRSVVWDLGEDFLSGGVFDHGALREYAVYPGGLSKSEAASKIHDLSGVWKERHGVAGPVLVTGDLAGSPPPGLKSETVPPKNVPGLAQPAQAAAAGLLMAASQRQKRGPYARTGGQLAGRVRERANTLIQEYF